MPLNSRDRRFLGAVERMKVYVLLMAGAVLAYLLLVPSTELQMATSVIGITLCGIFWLTQRLLTFITELDTELTRLVNVVKRTLTDDQRRQLFPPD